MGAKRETADTLPPTFPLPVLLLDGPVSFPAISEKPASCLTLTVPTAWQKHQLILIIHRDSRRVFLSH